MPVREIQALVHEKEDSLGDCEAVNAQTAPLNQRPQLIAIAAAALFLAWVGPFGTQADLGFWARLFYWAGSIGATSAIIFGLLGKALPAMTTHRGAMRIAIGGGALVLTAAAIFAVVAAFEAIFRKPLSGAVIALTLSNILALTAAMSGVVLLVRSRQRAVERLAVAAPPSAPDLPTALHRRLPEAMRAAPIVALRAEDHYVRVYTAAGNALIAGRIADLIGETAPVAGVRAHRSWWAANWAVRGIEKRGRQRVLVLESGLRVPVSRARAAKLEGEGWRSVKNLVAKSTPHRRPPHPTNKGSE